MRHLTFIFKCIINILKQEVTGMTVIEAGITFFMAKKTQHEVHM